MEKDSFNPYTFEQDSSSPSEKKPEKDKKKKEKSASDLAKLLAKSEAASEEPKKAESAGASIDKPAVLGPLVETSTEQADAKKDKNERTDTIKTDIDSSGEQQNNSESVEILSPDERIDVTKAVVHERLEDIERDNEQTDEDLAAEKFLENLDEQLAQQTDGENDVDAAIDRAFTETVRNLDETTEPEPEQYEAALESEPSINEDEPQELNQDNPIVVTPPRAGGGITPPPRPPVTSFGSNNSGPMWTAQPMAAPTFALPTRHNQPSTERIVSEREARRRERIAMGQGVLVGGIVGYLIGKRRGRIKTEKNLNGVQKKLEKQVTDLHDKIEIKESQIRSFVHERRLTASNRSPETPVVRAETRSVGHPERGRDTVVRPEVRTPKPETTKAAIDALSKNELLAFSAQIQVGETNLRRVFEAEMIDERALRRLIYEYQAGHDVRRALAREFLAKELRFERDPSLRDILPAELQPTKRNKASAGTNQDQTGPEATGASSALSGSLSKAKPAPISGGEHTMADTKHAIAPTRRNQSTVPTTVLVGLTIATILLALYAVWLTANR